MREDSIEKVLGISQTKDFASGVLCGAIPEMRPNF
jgi:hypothetical protein